MDSCDGYYIGLGAFFIEMFDSKADLVWEHGVEGMSREIRN